MSWRNKRVLRCFLKVPKVSQFLSSCGRLLHTRGAATENRQPPNTVLQRAQSAGLESTNVSDEVAV